MPELTVCTEPRCGRLIQPGSPNSRCRTCNEKRATRPPRKDPRRGRADPFYTTPEWRRLRKLVLARDDYACQLRLPGCTGAATEVDHIHPRSRGGAGLDADNCRASCMHCNRKRGNRPT